MVSSRRAPRIRVSGRPGGSSGAVDLRHHRDTGFETGQAECEFGEDDEGYRDHHPWTAVFGGHRVPPVDDEVGGLRDAPEAVDYDDQIQGQVDRDQSDGEGDGLGEAAQEDRRERAEQDERDDDLPARHPVRHKWILDEVSTRVGRRQRHRDEEVGGREPEEHEYEDLAAPLGQQVFEHRDGALTAGGFAGHVPVDGERAEQGQCDEDDGGQWGDRARGECGDARLVPECGEVVDTGQTHDLPPRVSA